jgi:hypothetical protein
MYTYVYNNHYYHILMYIILILNTCNQCKHVIHVIHVFQACGPCAPLTPDVIQDHIVVSSSRDLSLQTWLEVLYSGVLGAPYCLWFFGKLMATPQHVNGTPNGIAIFMKITRFSILTNVILQMKMLQIWFSIHGQHWNLIKEKTWIVMNIHVSSVEIE